MIKMQAIGHLGRDAEINVSGNKPVINFSIAHTEKYKDQAGTTINKTVWIKCAWWTDKTTISQYLKKGTQIYVEGQPGVNMWIDNSGENKSELTLRVHSVQLLGGKKEEGQGTNQQNNSHPSTNTGYTPVATDIPIGDDDLPF
jgi:single-strand DNA-binding protein